MPAYDFRCTRCRHTFEVTRAARDSSAVACPECGGDTKRVFTPVGIQFKGSGFHNTDYRGDKPSDEKKTDAGSPESAPACPAAPGGCAGCPAASGE